MDLGKVAKTYVRTLQEIVKDHYLNTVEQISNNEWTDTRIVRKQSNTSSCGSGFASDDDGGEGAMLLEVEGDNNSNIRHLESNAKVAWFSRTNTTRHHTAKPGNQDAASSASQQQMATETKGREWSGFGRSVVNDDAVVATQPPTINATLALKLSLPGPLASWIPAMHPSILTGTGFSVDKCFSIPHVTATVNHQGELASHCAACQKTLSRFRILSMTCRVCDLTYCSDCYGSNLFSKCCRDSGCKACADIVRKHIRFHNVELPILELGIACTLSLQFGDNSISEVARRPEDYDLHQSVWLCYNADHSTIRWRTLEMRHNVPLDCGDLPVGRIFDIEEDKGSGQIIRVAIRRGPAKFWKIEFASQLQCRQWTEGLKLAWELFGPQQQQRGV